MTITTYPPAATSTPPDASSASTLHLLSLSRLLARLEHNLLSPSADLTPLRRSEFQRMRVGANIDHARATLQTIERSLPQIKAAEKRHEIQTELIEKRGTLKRLLAVLEGLGAGVEGDDDDDDDDNEEEDESLDEELLATPEDSTDEVGEEGEDVQDAPSGTPTTATTATAPTTTSAPALPTSTLRNRHNSPDNQVTTSASATATATGSHIPAPSASTSPSQLQETEKTLSSHRAEQEDLTGSLVSLAAQLKSSSQAFQASLESEKSVLARAVDGLDRTTGNMESAERRMGMLRRMTEGKGWWGRMMLYAWIFGLWVVAVLIVFLGPKLRF